MRHCSPSHISLFTVTVTLNFRFISVRFGLLGSVRSAAFFVFYRCALSKLSLENDEIMHSVQGFHGNWTLSVRTGPVQQHGPFNILYLFERANTHSSPPKRQNHVLSLRGSPVIYLFLLIFVRFTAGASPDAPSIFNAHSLF